MMIRVQNLTKNFGDLTAVGDVSFEIAEGEMVAFLGPNGAGKTTTIKMLTTLLRPTSGHIEVDGFNPTTHPNEVRKRFGIVFQDASLDDELTAQENLDMHGALYRVPRRVCAERATKPARVCSNSRTAGMNRSSAFRAACAAGSKSPAVCFTRRGSCFWMNPRSGSIRRRATSFGRKSGN